MGSETREGRQILGTSDGRRIDVCSPVNGTCAKCIVGRGRFCLSCNDNNNKETFENEFVVLPGSKDKPILGIKSMRDMDLVGKYPLLFRTADALARESPPVAVTGDRVAPRTSDSSDLPPTKGDESPESDTEVSGPHLEGGIRAVTKSRRVLRVGKRRIDGRSVPNEAGTHGRRFGGEARKLRELQQLIATLKEQVPRYDGSGGAAPTSSESNSTSGAIAEGTTVHRDDIFTIVEEDTEAAEAEEAWMEKRELIYKEATTNPLDQIQIEGPPSLKQTVTAVVRELKTVFRAQVRPEPAQFRDQLHLNVDDQAWVNSGNAFQRLRPANAEKQEEMRRQTQELLDRDCIEPYQEPIFSQPVLAKKPNTASGGSV